MGGRLITAMIGPIESVHPYDFENGRLNNRPALVDDLLYEALMLEDPVGGTERMYPLVARALRVPEDMSYVVFELNPAARFSDGAPVTGADVAFSFEVLRASHPITRASLDEVVQSLDTRPGEIRFNLKTRGQRARDAVMILARIKIVRPNSAYAPSVGGIPVRYTGTGPYRITALGHPQVTLVRMAAELYWGSTLGTRRGFFNFQAIDIMSFPSEVAARQALMDGKTNFLVEAQSNPALNLAADLTRAKARTLLLLQEPNDRADEGHMSYAFNLDRVKDLKVRQAILLAYDFEGINRDFFASQLRRAKSVLDGSPLEPAGPPSPSVQVWLARCTPFAERDQAFETYGNAMYARFPDRAARMAQARHLLDQAGYGLVNGVRVKIQNGQSQFLKLKILGADNAELPALLTFREALAELGVSLDVEIAPHLEAFNQSVASNDYDLATAIETFLSKDRWPRAGLARYLFDSSLARTQSLSTANPYRLRKACADEFIQTIAGAHPFSQFYRDASEALARLQQALTLNIYTGEPRSRYIFLDRRILVPPGLSAERAHLYGYWGVN